MSVAYAPWDLPTSTLVLPEDVAYLVDRILSEPADWPIAWDLETTGLSPVADRVVGAALSLGPDHGVYLPLRHTRITQESVLTEKEAKRKKPPLRQILGTEEHTANLIKAHLDAVHAAIVQSGRPVVMHNAGFDLSMSKGEGWLFPNALYDTRVAKWILSRGLKPPVVAGKGPFSLKNLAKLELGEDMTTFNEVSDPRGIQYTEPEAAAEYAAADARNTLRLWSIYKKQLEDSGFWKVFYELEMPCVHMIAHMRRTGFTLDKEHMLRCHEQVAEEQVRVLAKLSELVGQEYPATKAQKLSRLMYDTLGWWNPGERERGKARAKGDPLGFYPTDEEALLYQLKAGTDEGKKAALLTLRFRKLETMKVRYTKSFVEYVDADGRLRSDFNSMGADTGRFTSSDPPLQVLPRPVDDSQPDLDPWMKGLPAIRDAFVAPAGRKLIDIDFSQIELRVLAHLSRDKNLLAAYRTWKCGACGRDGETDSILHACPACGTGDTAANGKLAKMNLDFTPQPGLFCLGLDVHQLTANEIGCSRQDAKPINFGLCIAAGQRVLTSEGLVPIELVRRDHLLWDGVEWVSHDGVLDKGVRCVMTHDGVTATPDHMVYTEGGWRVPIGGAASALRAGRLACGANAGVPVRYSEFDRRSGEGREESLRAGGVFDVQAYPIARYVEHSFGEDNELCLHANSEVRRRPESQDTGRALRLYGAEMHPGYAQLLAQLQGPWDQSAVRLAGALHTLGIGDVSRFGLRWSRLRPQGQRRPLLAGQPAARYSAREPAQQARVYDILNAGPRHRFCVEGKIVSNCYGMSSWLLAQVLDVDQDTADEYHARYFASYKGVAKYHANIENLLLKQWYVPTVTGRHRRFEPVPVERNRAGRPKGAYGHAFRAATNTTVQGSAADIMKLAMRNVFRRMQREGHLEQDFWFVSTVHDELICEASDTFAPEAAAIMQAEFEGAMKLRVPLVANPQVGNRWSECH